MNIKPSRKLRLKLLHCMCCNAAMRYQLTCKCEDPLNPCIECNKCSVCCLCALEKSYAYLEKLGYSVEPPYSGSNNWIIKAPSWHTDLVMSPEQVIAHATQLQEQRGDAL
jgi:hypothetical protein